MMRNPSWQYDEFRQVGKDYSLPREVEAYDASHADFRDITQESQTILDVLGIGDGQVVVDFGTGTGTFAVEAARRGAKVYAVDVSEAMLAYARQKATKAGVDGITFCHSGFLNFELNGEGADAIVSVFSFHHLPDFWKGIALTHMHRMLKPGGRLYLHDVVVATDNALANVSAFIDKLAEAGGDFMREDAEGHFREEFSTYDWVMDGLLMRAGFDVESKVVEDGVLATYHCAKLAGVQLK